MVIALVLALCAACTADEQALSNEEQSAQELAGALAEARAAGADASQIDVLSGTEVTFQQYQEAVERALSCMRDAGLQVVNDEVIRWNGQDIVSYAVGAGSVPEDQAFSVQDACYAKYAQFVDGFWQTSTPEALAYEERRAEALREPLARCLSGYGVDLPADASFRDLLVLANSHVGGSQDEDCMNDIGYATWEG